MQTFQTAAVVGLIDNMSGPLKTLAAQAKQLAKTIDAGKFDQAGLNNYTSGIGKANTAAREHLGLARRIHATWKEVGGIVGGLFAGKIAHGSLEAIKNYAPLEAQTRYQKAIGVQEDGTRGYSKPDMELLDRQMQVAADKWGMKLLDTKNAQMVFTGRHFTAGVTEAATNASIVFARAMNIGASEAGKTLEGLIFGQGIHLKDPATAARESMRMADMAAVAAKQSSMTPEDIQQLSIYGMAPAHAAGLSPEQVFATGMTFKRANIDGTQAGTFMRAAASRLMAPTSMGRDALTLMLARQGKTLDDYTRGGDLSPEAIDKAMAMNGRGLRLGAKGIASLRSSIEEGTESEDPTKDVMGNRANFAAAVRTALEASGQKFDKGEVPKMVGQALRLRDIAREKVQLDALYDNILHNATQQEKIKIFGDKQGGRAASLDPTQYDEYKKSEEGSAGYAMDVAKERMEGFNAAMQRLEAGFDNFSQKMVQANERWLTPLMTHTADMLNAFANMSEFGREALTAAGAVVSLAAAAKGATMVLGLLGGGKAAAGTAAETVVETAAKRGLFGWLSNQLLFGVGGRMTAGALGVGLVGGAALGAAGYLMYEGLGPENVRGSTDAEKRFNQAFPYGLPEAAKQRWMASQRFGKPSALTGNALDGAQLAPPTTGWSSATSWSPDVGKKGDFAPVKDVNVTGTITGSAEIHSFIEVRPTAYLEAIVQRAENAANMTVSGKLGTGMQGPGDNGTKPPPSALTKANNGLLGAH